MFRICRRVRKFNIPIFLSNSLSDTVVFHAGTKKSNDSIVTAGGRVIVVTSYAPTLRQALDLVYQGVDKISFEGKTYRRDIAHRALKAAESKQTGLTYAQAGVSVDAGNSLVEAIKPYVRSTRRTGADAEIGGFGGVFDLQACGYQDPVLVSGTDGVGTKLRVAVDAGIHDTVGMYNRFAVSTSLKGIFSRHRSRRNGCQRSISSGRRAIVFPRLLRLQQARSLCSLGRDQRHRRRLQTSQLRLDWWRNCRDAGDVPARLV